MTLLSHDPLWPRAGKWPAYEASDDAQSTPVQAKYDAVLVGVPTYKTSLSATNANKTPEAVRAAMQRYSEHFAVEGGNSPETEAVLTDILSIADAGDLNDPDEQENSAIADLGRIAFDTDFLIALGGDNALTYPVATASLGHQRDTAGIITIDAHHDLRDGVSNGSPIRRLIDAGFAGERIVQIAIQDFANSRFYRERANKFGVSVISRDQVEAQPLAQTVADALDIAGSAGGPIHVDVDVDACDRSVAPGCPASLPGGLSAYQLRRLVRLLSADSRVISIDFAEVDATADVSDERTVRLVALGVLDALAGFASRSATS